MSDSAKIPEFYSTLIQFLEQPESYPYQVDSVEHIQTHISHVFIADPYVYKIKKPVDFGFLDYSTLEKRKHFCEREIELNRRLCDNVYLEVIQITSVDGSFHLEEKQGTVVEYAVKMKKLPEEYFLHSLIERDALTEKHLDRVADKLAVFYREQEPGQEVLEFGTIEKIKYNTDENFRQTQQFIGKTIDRASHEAVKSYTNSYFEHNQGLFERRIREQRIVDGHGDLHLDHIHITPEKVRIYDCIEFNKRFRYGDLAVDLAFLAMDLDFNGRRRDERYFVDLMSNKLGDTDLNRLINFYKCYRAYVKGKVKSLQSEEEEVFPEERQRALETASRYFDLSLKYATIGSEPLILIFMGRIGSGKSTIAGRLAGKLSLESYSSDRIRKTLAGLPLHERPDESIREQLYTSDMSERTYSKLREQASDKFNQAESVILDATFSKQAGRQELVHLLKEQGADYLFIETRASEKAIKKRLRERDGRSDIVSDARLEDFDQLDKNYVPPDEIAPSHLVTLNTEQPIEQTLGDFYLKLVQHHIKYRD